MLIQIFHLQAQGQFFYSEKSEPRIQGTRVCGSPRAANTDRLVWNRMCLTILKKWRKRNWHSPGGWKSGRMCVRHAITRTHIKQNSIAWIAMVRCAPYA